MEAFNEPHGSIATMRGESSPQQLLSAVSTLFVRTLVAVGFSAQQIQESVAAAIGAQESIEGAIPAVSLGRELRDCMEVMCLWRREPKFLGPDGLARALVIDGCAGSFQDLYEQASPSGDYERGLRELMRFGAVRKVLGNRVEPLTPTFVVSGFGVPAAVDVVMKIMAGHLGVIEHNVLSRQSGWSPRFERSCTVAVAEEVQPIAERLIAERGQIFIDTVDEHLMRLAKTSSQSGRRIEMGAGAFCMNLGFI